MLLRKKFRKIISSTFHRNSTNEHKGFEKAQTVLVQVTNPNLLHEEYWAKFRRKLFRASFTLFTYVSIIRLTNSHRSVSTIRLIRQGHMELVPSESSYLGSERDRETFAQFAHQMDCLWNGYS